MSTCRMTRLGTTPIVPAACRTDGSSAVAAFVGGHTPAQPRDGGGGGGRGDRRPTGARPGRRLAHDAAAELGLARPAVAEGDRELDDLAAGSDDAVGHLDLEPVAVGRHRVEVHPPQRFAAVRPVAGRGVVDRQPSTPAA